MKAKLVIKLGALDDLVEQLKKAATEGPMNGMNGMNGMDESYGKDEYEKDMSPEYEWVCEQCDSEFCTPTAKEFIRCPLDGTEMKKVSESK